MRLGVAIAAAILLVPSISGQETADAPRLNVLATSPVTIGQKVVFKSQVLNADVTMNIYIPESFDISSSDHTYPVIFANGGHGEQFFSTLVGIVKHLGDRERIPESIVVSLNDLGDIPEIFTHGMWSARETLGGSGDPAASLRHLEDEVIPYLESTYRANGYRLMVGVSGSSLFPVHTFTAAPGLFDSHILIASADILGMGYDRETTFIDTFEAALATTPKRRAKLYVGVADSDLEGEDGYQRNLDQLTARVGELEQVDLRVEVVPKDDHYAVFIKAMLSALDQNFPDQKWSSRYRDLVAQPGDALANIDRYYRQLSDDYGFQILPRADRWNNVNSLRFMTRHLIQLGRADEAIAVAKRRIEYRPSVAASYSGLADAFEADGQLQAAINVQQQAVDLARVQNDPQTEPFKERLKTLRQASDSDR